MKKLLLFIAILISGMGLFAQNIGDETIIDYEGYSLKFTVTNLEPAECEIKCSTKPTSSTEIVIPSSVTIEGMEFSVTSIGEYAFSYCSNLTSIEIPNSVTSIGYQAFYNCNNLTSIEIPNSVTSIGTYAFSNCTSLTSIEIPNSVTSIGYRAFYSCDNLTSIEIPNSVTSIGDSAFSDCTSLTSITVEEGNPVYDSRNNCNAIIETETNTLIAGCQNTIIPNSVTSIGYMAFYNCNNLTSIEIPNSVTSIGNHAFSDCDNLTSIEIPNSVTSIDNYAFSYCDNLTSIEIPNSVTSIGDNAFFDCTSLTNIEIPNSVTSISYQAFYNCTSLTSIEIPNSVTSIGNSAFSYCTSLTSIEIPNSVTSIGNYAFSYCTSLTSIEIPNSVTSIGDMAFHDCDNLTSIEIPNSITSIGNQAFSNCDNLTSITVEEGNPVYDSRNNCNAIIETETNTLIAGCQNTIIPNSVTSIGNYAFYSCDNLTSIEIPNSVTSIGNYAFSYCYNLTSIEIPNSVTSIGNSAFRSCTSLTSIEIPNSITSIGDNAFEDCSSLTSIEIPNSVTSIGNYAFSNCDNLTSIEIPNSVTSIGNYAFFDCTSLTSIEIPNSVTSIGNYAFSASCSNLTSITVEVGNPVYDSRNNCNAIIETESNTLIAGCQNTIIPNSVTSIGDYAFSWCTSLTSIEIPNSVTSIGSYAFVYCTSLTSIEIPNSVTSIGEWAFYYCTSLTSIEIPNSVTSIGNDAFYYCTSLTSIEIPNSVTSIGEWAFWNCYNLTSIYCYAENVPETGSSAFNSCPSDMVIYVPAQSVDAYKAASPWNEYTIMAMGEIVNHWTPDESLYANNMSVIGLIQIDGVNQNSTSLEIGAFCGEEVRGSQFVQYIPALDKYLVFLTIHGEGSEEISFKLYDHFTEEELDLRSPEAITFAVNGTLGSVTSPYILNFSNMVEITAIVSPSEAGVVTGTGIYAVYDTATLVTTPNEGFSFKNWTVNGNVVSTDSEYSFVVTEAVELVANYNYVQTRELKSGWSWFSSFIEFDGEEGLEMMEDALGENGLQIKNQTEFVVNSDGAWYGSLMAANSDMMFMLETSAPQTFTLVGPKVNPEEHPLTVGTNWRWISYPLDINLSVDEALATIVPQTGDYIKSKNAFSQYYEGAGWLGALSTMNPGEGYMYQNVSGTTKTLVYPSESATRSMKANVTAENNYWVPNAGKFAGNMSVIAVVESNGIEMSDYEIAAFVGDEIRGSARPIYIEVLDKHMIFMTVYGSGKEEITFKYYDINADAIENVTSREEIVFADNATYGSIENAIVLTCGVTGIGENDTEALNVYPNPANINAEISLGTTYDRVEIYNAIGVKIAEYADVNRIGGIEAAGVYVIKVMNDDATRNCRIVVR